MRYLRFLLTPLVACALLAGGLSPRAQGSAYSQDQINQMVAPIALYSDALMSEVLMAATFPDQVTEAYQWTQANPGLTGDGMDGALATATWDPSVVALCKLPAVLQRLAQNIDWTTDLGQAFLNQKDDVLNAAQTLRTAAYQNGHLRTTPQQRVVVEDEAIMIQPSTPSVIYVPTYEPAVVYGPAWSYPTLYYPGVWAPLPGLSFIDGFAWGLGCFVGNILFGGCDWFHHDLYVNNGAFANNAIYRNTPYYGNGSWRGGDHHQPWTRQAGRVDYARGGTGSPYGGRDHGSVHGVNRGSAGFPSRGTERANRNDPAGYPANGSVRPAVHDPTGHSESRYPRPPVDKPTDVSGSRYPRPAVDNPTGRSASPYTRPAVHSPRDYQAQGNTRPTSHGPAGYSGSPYARPAVHSPRGYPAQGNTRPTAHGPAGYSGSPYTRSETHAPAGRSRSDYSRPAARVPAQGYSHPGHNRSAVHAPAPYSRPGNNHPNVRASGGVQGGHALGSHTSAARHAPAAQGGGQKQHRHR